MITLNIPQAGKTKPTSPRAITPASGSPIEELSPMDTILRQKASQKNDWWWTGPAPPKPPVSKTSPFDRKGLTAIMRRRDSQNRFPLLDDEAERIADRWDAEIVK